MKKTHTCLECGKPVSEGLYAFSTEVYQFPLCMHHLYLVETRGISDQALRNHFSKKIKKASGRDRRILSGIIIPLAHSVSREQMQ